MYRTEIALRCEYWLDQTRIALLSYFLLYWSYAASTPARVDADPPHYVCLFISRFVYVAWRLFDFKL
jgi:hypothetical protein